MDFIALSLFLWEAILFVSPYFAPLFGLKISVMFRAYEAARGQPGVITVAEQATVPRHFRLMTAETKGFGKGEKLLAK